MQMGEAAPCLMRSISQPLFASCGLKEGDRLRALTTSVSFGRFMTEPLDWEKWSSFSHNRTLEDVQKYSRPGAVAEKKAFFEAYYKNFAPKKENKPPKFSNIDENSNLGFSETGNVDVITCQVEHEKISTENVSLPTNNLGTGVKPEIVSNLDSNNLEIGNVNGVILSTDAQLVDDDALNTRGVEPEISVKEDSGLPSTNLVFSEKHQLQAQISNHVVRYKKTQMKDKISVQSKAEICRIKSSSRKVPIAEMQQNMAAPDLMEKKKSLHLSIKFPASLNKNINLKTLSKPKDRLSQQALTRVSSVNGIKKNSQVLPTQENKRSKPLLNGIKTTVLKSLSTNHSEASIASTKKPRSTTVFSSFSFRSDERAAKRKEFFQRLEEKGNTNNTKKTRLQPKSKETGRSDNRKLSWATVLPAKPKLSTSETKGPDNIIQKVQSKLGKKNFIEINKKNLCRSMACLASKKLHDSTLMLKK